MSLPYAIRFVGTGWYRTDAIERTLIAYDWSSAEAQLENRYE